jgi:hypothetical protein
MCHVICEWHLLLAAFYFRSSADSVGSVCVSIWQRWIFISLIFLIQTNSTFTIIKRRMSSLATSAMFAVVQLGASNSLQIIKAPSLESFNRRWIEDPNLWPQAATWLSDEGDQDCTILRIDCNC